MIDKFNKESLIRAKKNIQKMDFGKVYIYKNFKKLIYLRGFESTGTSNVFVEILGSIDKRTDNAIDKSIWLTLEPVYSKFFDHIRLMTSEDLPLCLNWKWSSVGLSKCLTEFSSGDTHE